MIKRAQYFVQESSDLDVTKRKFVRWAEECHIFLFHGKRKLFQNISQPYIGSLKKSVLFNIAKF